MGSKENFLLVLFLLVLLRSSSGQERSEDERLDDERPAEQGPRPALGDTGFDIDHFAVDIEDPFGRGEWRDEHDEQFREDDEGHEGGDHVGEDHGGEDHGDEDHGGEDHGGDDGDEDGDGSDDDDGDEFFDEFFPAPGVIINDFTFDDAVNIFGDAARADTILQSVGVVCENRNAIGIELPPEVDDVCGLVETALDNNQPITGVEEFCDDLFNELSEGGDDGGDSRKKRNVEEGEEEGEERERGREYQEDGFPFFGEALSMRFHSEFGYDFLDKDEYCNALEDFIARDDRPVKEIMDNIVRTVISVALDLWSPQCFFYNGSGEDWGSYSGSSGSMRFGSSSGSSGSMRFGSSSGSSGSTSLGSSSGSSGSMSSDSKSGSSGSMSSDSKSGSSGSMSVGSSSGSSGSMSSDSKSGSSGSMSLDSKSGSSGSTSLGSSSGSSESMSLGSSSGSSGGMSSESGSSWNGNWGSDFNSSWNENWSSHHLDPLGYLFALIGGYDSMGELCQHVVVHDFNQTYVPEDLVNNITNNLIEIAYNEDECLRVGEIIFEELFEGEASDLNMTAEMCSVLVSAFGANVTDNVFIVEQDIIDYIFGLREMYNYSAEPPSRSSDESLEELEGFSLTRGANTTDELLLRWYSVFDPSEMGPYAVIEYLRPDLLIQLYGRMYNARNSREAFKLLCDSLSPAIRGPDLNEMCKEASHQSFDRVREVCSYWGYYGLAELFDWDAYWEVFYLDWYLEEWDRNENETRFWFMEEIRWPILEEFDLYWSPFPICRFFGEEIVKTPSQVQDDVYRALERVVLRSFNSLIDEPCRRIKENRSSDFVENFGDDHPEPQSIKDYVLAMYTYMGGFSSPLAFCTSLYDITENLWEIQPDQVRGLLDTMKANLELVATDEETCGEFVTVLTDLDAEFSISDWTGFTDADTFCVALVDAAEGDGPSVQWSSLVDMALNIEPASSSSELPPGFLLEEVPVKIVLASLGVIWNSGTVIEGMAIVCNNMVPLLAELTDLSKGEINEMCGALSDSDIKIVQRKCEAVLTPYFYGEHYPTAGMAELDGEALLEVMKDTLGWESFDQEGVCPGVESLLNADFGFVDLFVTMMEGILPYIGTESALPFCHNKEQIKAFWQGTGPFYDESRSDYDERLREAPKPDIEYDLLDSILGVATGMGSIDSICDDLMEADEDGETSAFYSRVIDGVFGLVNNVDRCTVAAETMLNLLLPELDISSSSESSSLVPWADPIYWATGLRTPKAVCTKIVQSFTGQQAERCRGIVDCAGICNGNSREDCAGVCNGGATYDCAGACNGGAFINNCTECVGGRTGRAVTFGMDKCGLCRKAPGYRKTWDCHGECDGSAEVDRCGQCVGGTTGLSLDTNAGRLDCREVCDGGWVADTCNYCEPPAKQGVVYDGGSKYKDCTGGCIRPGAPRAEENDCGVCWGGSTGVLETEGVNVCGQCESSSVADVMSCAGCDGVPASGVEYDACGVCGGDGTDCVAVGLVIPNIVPNVQTRVRVAGAGFSAGALLTCLFTLNGQTTEGAATRIDTTILLCDVPALTPGDYAVGVRRNSDLPSEITSTLRVFQDVEVVEISPTTFTVNRSLETVEITVTVATGGLASLRAYSEEWNVIPTLTVLLDNGFLRSFGTFESDETMSFLLGMPYNSGYGVVVPSVNGGATALGEYSVNGYAYFQAPTLERIQFSDTGASLLVTFDMPVDYENLRSCKQIFTSTQSLGQGALCLWLYPTAMLILIGRGSNLVEIGSPLIVKPEALKAFRQDFSYAVESKSYYAQPPNNPVQPEAVVTGPPKLPSCGNIRIDARRSTGSGGRAMSYYWEVESTGSTTSLDNALNDINTNSPSPSLALDGDLMDADTDYVFTVNVTNFLGGWDVASLTVHRTGIAAPEVKILSSGVDLTSVRVSNSFELTAQVKFYSECVPPGETLFEWSVNNTDVALNLKTQYTRSLNVPAYSLPAGEDLTFTVRVYKSSNPSAYVEASIGATTVSSPLVAVIRGPSELTIGRDSGEVVLDGSLSYDPDAEARDWEYEWLCVQTDDNSACWSYDPSSIGTLINNGSNIDGAYLRFDALSLQADKSYTFTLVASKEARSATASVYISAVNGNPPKIEIPPRSDNGEVKDNRPFFLSAIIRHSTDLANVTWETTDTDSGYGFLDFDETSNLLVPATVFPMGNGVSAALLVVKDGVVSRGTSYSIRINATTIDGQVNSVKTYISVLSGPTSCDFVLPDNYTEFEEVTFSIENCVSTAEPLQYQLHVVKEDGSVAAFKDTTPEPTFTSVGAPRLSGSNIRNYVMKVCDSNDICSVYEGNVTVLEKVTFTEAEVTAYISDQVDTPKFAGDFSLALTNLNMVSDRGLVSRRRRRTAAEDSTSTTTTDQLELIQLTIDETVMTPSRAQLLLDQTESVDPTTMVLADQSDFVTQLETIIDVFIEADEPIPSASATTVSGKLDVISEGLDPVYHESILTQISTVRSKLASSLASGLSVGSPRSEIDGTDGVSSVMRTLLSDPIDSKTSGTPISINFGSEVAELFSASWICSSGESCSGVTLKIQHYNTGVDLLSTEDDHINYRVADILDIVLTDPESDEKLNISGLTTPILLNFTITNPLSEVDNECVYWDGTTWSTDGLATTENGDGTITCATDHLTTFTVMGVPWPSVPTTEADEIVTAVPENLFGLSTKLIIIISASAAFGLILLTIFTVFLCKHCGKSKAKVSARDVPDSIQPQVQPQMQPQMQPQLQPQQFQLQPQPQPMVALIGIPVIQGQYGMGYNHTSMAAVPRDAPPVYDIPDQGYSTQVGGAQPYGSTVATAPPKVTLVGNNNNLVQVGMASDPPSSYSGKAAQSGEMSSYLTAVTSGLPGIGGTEHVAMKTVSGSKASLTGHF